MPKLELCKSSPGHDHHLVFKQEAHVQKNPELQIGSGRVSATPSMAKDDKQILKLCVPQTTQSCQGCVEVCCLPCRSPQPPGIVRGRKPHHSGPQCLEMRSGVSSAYLNPR